VLVCLDHVASFIVNANHGRRPAGRPQSRSFAPRNPPPRHSPNSNRVLDNTGDNRWLPAHALPLSDFGSKRFVIYVFRMNDSRWIRWFAITNAVLTAGLVFLTIVLVRYASRLDVLTDSLVASQRPNQPSNPTPEQSPTPTPTVAPIPRAIPIATPSLTPSPSPQPTRVPRRHPRRHR
jgi:hypothetical protein